MSPRRRIAHAVLVATLLSALAPAGRAAAERDDEVRQRIVVSAPNADSPTGELTAYQLVGDRWEAVLGPVPADLGELGVGAPADDVFRTPVGTFPLGQAFGRKPDPGTRMPYFQTTDEDWWDEDQESRTYNQHVRTADLSWSDDAENLYDSGSIYDYAVLIDHNPERVLGRSAGIFLHVTDGDPTWGCVAIDEARMVKLLAWLDPAAHPQITIGVDAGPPAS
ncbi:L,D-transpeptidase family protein [Mycolicibacterium grossiae]|uniref:L,D-TPase catalytic domain-containing protein n=1 Tax=Mycolicibacterium grossiae TaxID=1552759 RepID=A0A1E8Q986_9MYCO|nr:L,D-transpeptidase family protein [Mycolicibacterium grossiae]OFJ54534.1 hypothetical protein BEL07_06815 [Mycolicibacterium grossiae]QEM45882.1 L,D-transpeptidase family protein [Mycolicibacterium grossiae]